MLLTPIIIIKFIIYLKQIGGLFLHNCNFILTISLLRYFFRKIMLKYGLNLLIFNKLSVYLFVLHNYISCFVVTNIYLVSISIIIPTLLLFIPNLPEYESFFYSFLEFITSYTRLYFENKIDLQHITTAKIYTNTQNMVDINQVIYKSRVDIEINYTFVALATLTIVCVFVFTFNFTSIYVN